MCADKVPKPTDARRQSSPFRLGKLLLISIPSGLLLGFIGSLVLFIQDADFKQIRGAWLAERLLAKELEKHGARFNEIIWRTPENGESFLFAFAYKRYRQVQHIRFTHSDVSDVPFSRLSELEDLNSIDLSDTNVRADQIGEMRNRAWVQINLRRTKVTTEVLRNLVTTNRLTYLSLAGSTVTDEMLASLTNSTIQVFSLGSTKISDAGMGYLAHMRSVQSLSLAGTRVGDEGLQLLSKNKFFDLNLSGSKITDAGLTNLLVDDPGTRLELNLSNTRISDAGMTVFKRLKFVTELNLANTQVSDAGVEALKEQRYLRWVCLGGTKVTPAGIESLLKTRVQQRAGWKSQDPRGIVEPPEIMVVMDVNQTKRPSAYPRE